MTYVNVAVIPVPTKNKDAYKDLATSMAAVFKKHGALTTAECWGDQVPPGEITSFPAAVQCKDDETVVVSWVIWPDQDTAQSGMQSAMQDPDFQMKPGAMPFDGKRMIFGGFSTLVAS